MTSHASRPTVHDGHGNHFPATALDAMLAAVPRLTPSVEPSVVFMDLAELCVPAFSDVCSIDLTEDAGLIRRIHHPCTPDTSEESPNLASVDAGHSSRSPIYTPFVSSPQDPGPPYHGVVAHFRRAREFRPGMAAIAGLLVDRAVTAVTQQRLTRAHGRLEDQAANLRVALRTSRQIGAAIGILMAVHRITEDAAFDMLRRASQASHRKLRQIADEVIHTGCLEIDGAAGAAPVLGVSVRSE